MRKGVNNYILIPYGTIIQSAAVNIPNGWLLCNGDLLSRLIYANLFSAVGYTYGGSDLSFNIPDLRGRSVIGAGTGSALTTRNLGDLGGAETFAKNIGGKILKSIMGITESFNLSSFGNNSKSLGGKIFIPKNDNVKIKSPVSGTAVDIISNSSCVNQIVIEFNHEGQPHYLEYCGIKRPSVQVGEKIFIDKVLGHTDSNVL